MTTVIWGGCSGHTGQHGPGTPMWLMVTARPQASVWPLLTTQVMDINTDPGCGRNVDPDKVLGSSLAPDVIMAPGGSVGYSYWQWPWQQRSLWTLIWPQVVAQILGHLCGLWENGP